MHTVHNFNKIILLKKILRFHFFVLTRSQLFSINISGALQLQTISKITQVQTS